MTAKQLSRRELERLLLDASEALNEVLEYFFPTTPEGVAVEESQRRELPESLRNAANVLDRIQAMQNTKKCDHLIIEDDCGSASCEKCGEDFGWYCQISTKRFCEYEGEEDCIHCGEPEERK